MVQRPAGFPSPLVGLLVLVLVVIGCGSSGLKLKLVNGNARKPSNVTLYFTVDTGKNEPLAGLTKEKFTIYEDGSKVSDLEGKPTMLDPKLAASHYTLLLIDASASVVESKKMGDVVNAAGKFTAKVEKQQMIAIAAFDGGPELYGIVPFTENPEAAHSGVEKLLTLKPKDPSTNLNGAVLEGLKTLRKALDADPKPIKVGTLVVFTDGIDRATRVTRKELREAMERPEFRDFDVFAIGVGSEVENAHLEEIGRTLTVKERDDAKMSKAFEIVANKIESMSQRYYLLSYCTPSRAGDHEVRLETTAKEGKGSITYRFSADGFGPDCDPKTPFELDLAHPDKKDEKGAPGTNKGSVKVEKK